jgi:AraC-like DNA-binding protein
MSLVFLGCFNQAQKAHQVTDYCWLVVNLGGVNSMSVASPSGRPVCTLSGEQPSALLLPKGSVLDFDYGEGRENWVLMFHDGVVEESPYGVVFSWNHLQAELPAYHPLDSTQARRSKDYLLRILQAHHNPETDSTLALDLMICALMDCILNPELPIEQEAPAEALRKRIIGDRSFVMTLSALSLECGYSVDHMRRLFEARFDTTPKAFRTDYRMQLAQEFLKMHSYTVKQVGEQLGFSSPAHFSLAFKKHFGTTPGAVR